MTLNAKSIGAGLAMLAASAFTMNAQAFDISFDGFCDGLSINFGQDLTSTGASIGSCLTNRPANGNANAVLQPSVVIGGTIVVSSYAGQADRDLTFVLDFQNSRWRLYENAALFNQGTFSFGTPPLSSSSLSASGD